MAVFVAYFDASGNKRSRVLSMAGFVSSVPQWERFERDWRSLLPPGLDEFSMSAFVSSKQGWERWKSQSSKRGWFIDQLVSCIRKHTRKGFSALIGMNDYRAVDKDFAVTEYIGGPYSLAGFGCLKSLKQWAVKKHIEPGSILCTFEKGDDDQNAFISRAKNDGFNAIARDKKDIRAFDACDLAAWRAKAILDDALYRDFGIKEKPTIDRFHSSLNQLEGIITNPGVITAAILRKMCLDKELMRP